MFSGLIVNEQFKKILDEHYNVFTNLFNQPKVNSNKNKKHKKKK